VKALELTKKELELLDTLRQEARGCLTREMACFLLKTSPQAIGKLSLSLSAKGCLYRDGDGTVWLVDIEEKR
jgi:hypothetical protein